MAKGQSCIKLKSLWIRPIQNIPATDEVAAADDVAEAHEGDDLELKLLMASPEIPS